MKIQNRLIFYILILFSFGFIQCNLSKSKEYRLKQGELFRFIDHLKEENVIETPLKNLIKNFKLIEEDLSGKWTYLPEFSNDEYEVWGISTKFPIFAFNERKKPKGMDLFKKRKKIKFFTENQEQEEYWKWLQTNKIINLNSLKNYKGESSGVVVKRGEPLEVDIFLPDGEIILDIVAVNMNAKFNIPYLRVHLNEKIIGEAPISRKKFYRFREKVRLGAYKLKLEYINSNETSVPEKERFILIGMIKISTPKDMILLYHPRKDSVPSNSPGKYKIKYYITPQEKTKELIKQGILNLYEIQNKFPINDFNVKENPYQVKKKIKLVNSMINVLLSPPKSEYQFTVRIPSSAFLEFGCGFLERNWKRKGSGVTFKILIEDGKKKKLLFSKSLDPFRNPDDRNLFIQKIDLSSFENKKIKISFLTQRKPRGKSIRIEPSFWYNPIIYSPNISKEKELNVILISIDTLRPDHLSCYGYSRKTSPNIDKLAKDGILFVNSFSSTSWTLPAHISLLTSLDTVHHQVYFPFQRMNEEIMTLADILRNNNFYCSAFTGGGYLNAKYGFAKGFDSYQELKIKGDISFRYDEAEILSEKALSWIDQNKDKKFFLFLHTYQPHDPYANLSSTGKIFLDKNHKWERIDLGKIFKNGDSDRHSIQFTEEERKNIIALYDGEIKYTDEYFVKPLIRQLKELDLYNKTLIILTSDHGEEFYDHKAWLHDHSLYNEAIKIPLIIKFPNSKFQGKRIAQIVRLVDIMPSILDYLDIEYSFPSLDGKSLMNLIEGKEENNRTFISDLALRRFREIYPTIITINKNNLKLIVNEKIISPYVEEISTDFKEYKVELYDMENDPGEKINLAGKQKYHKVITELITLIRNYYQVSKKQKIKEITLDKELKERLRALGYIK
ncbi:MAG: sulfatase [Candidatus Aminicenantia bacterium]